MDDWEESAPVAVPSAPEGRPLVEAIAAALDAMRHCRANGNDEWRATHSERLESLCSDHMPSGSGFDSGTTLDEEASRPDCLVFRTSFHHMNDGGFYDGWTEHRVVVRPSFIGRFELKVTGRDKRGIKDYIGDTFAEALSVIVP